MSDDIEAAEDAAAENARREVREALRGRSGAGGATVESAENLADNYARAKFRDEYARAHGGTGVDSGLLRDQRDLFVEHTKNFFADEDGYAKSGEILDKVDSDIAGRVSRLPGPPDRGGDGPDARKAGKLGKKLLGLVPLVGIAVTLSVVDEANATNSDMTEQLDALLQAGAISQRQRDSLKNYVDRTTGLQAGLAMFSEVPVAGWASDIHGLLLGGDAELQGRLDEVQRAIDMLEAAAAAGGEQVDERALQQDFQRDAANIISGEVDEDGDPLEEYVMYVPASSGPGRFVFTIDGMDESELDEVNEQLAEQYALSVGSAQSSLDGIGEALETQALAAVGGSDIGTALEQLREMREALEGELRERGNAVGTMAGLDMQEAEDIGEAPPGGSGKPLSVA